jgi:hypothetical protein
MLRYIWVHLTEHSKPEYKCYCYHRFDGDRMIHSPIVNGWLSLQFNLNYTKQQCWVTTDKVHLVNGAFLNNWKCFTLIPKNVLAHNTTYSLYRHIQNAFKCNNVSFRFSRREMSGRLDGNCTKRIIIRIITIERNKRKINATPQFKKKGKEKTLPSSYICMYYPSIRSIYSLS